MRVHIKTERGKRLLDRLDEIENNENPRPVHTSVGVFLNVEELDKPKTNADGQEFTWIARDMFFDHDAILLDSIGAAQPGQGVGLAVNAKGEKFEVSRASLSDQTEACERVALSGDMRQNQDASFQQIIEQLVTDIQNKVAAKWVFSVDLFEDKFIDPRLTNSSIPDKSVTLLEEQDNELLESPGAPPITGAATAESGESDKSFIEMITGNWMVPFLLGIIVVLVVLVLVLGARKRRKRVSEVPSDKPEPQVTETQESNIPDKQEMPESDEHKPH